MTTRVQSGWNAIMDTIGGAVTDGIGAIAGAFGLATDRPDSATGLATSALAGAAAALAVAIMLSICFAKRQHSIREVLKYGVAAAAVVGLVAFVAYDMREAVREYLGLNRAGPTAEFEIRLPPSALAAFGRDAQVELHTDRNQTIANVLSLPSSDGGRPVLRGLVPIDFRTRDRLVILSLPGQGQHLFKLRLPANPSRSPVFGPWHLADRSEPAAAAAPPRDDYAIRYRVI